MRGQNGSDSVQNRQDEPNTVYYHLAEPRIEAEAHGDVDILTSRTAVGQTLTFSLMALGSEPRSQDWRTDALETASRTTIDYEVILQQIPNEDKALTPPSSVFRARIHPLQRSPIKLRSRKSSKAGTSCGSADGMPREDPASSSVENPDVETPTKPNTRARARAHARQSGTGQTRSDKSSSQAAEEHDVRQRQYCTQACLLGLVRQGPLDEACSNVSAHRVHGTSNRHALKQKTLAQHRST
jgi:hypothetical protein